MFSCILHSYSIYSYSSGIFLCVLQMPAPHKHIEHIEATCGVWCKITVVCLDLSNFERNFTWFDMIWHDYHDFSVSDVSGKWIFEFAFSKTGSGRAGNVLTTCHACHACHAVSSAGCAQSGTIAPIRREKGDRRTEGRPKGTASAPRTLELRQSSGVTWIEGRGPNWWSLEKHPRMCKFFVDCNLSPRFSDIVISCYISLLHIYILHV